MVVTPPVRVDFRADSGAAADLDPWRARLLQLIESQPPWLDLGRARVPASRLAEIPVGPTLLIGFGGSSLGARAALARPREEGSGHGSVRVLDSLDVAVVRDCLEWATTQRATLLVVSKSGGTVEVVHLLRAALGRGLGRRVLVSDPPDNALARMMGEHLRFEIPPEVGGRYSVFTAVGQVPLRAAGLDPHALLDGARTELEQLTRDASHLLAPLAWRAAHPATANVIWSYDESLLNWAAWLQQLECESLGRRHGDGTRVGELVTIMRGPADQHSVAQLLIDGPADKRVLFADFERDFAPEDLREVSRLRAIERDATFEAMTLPSQRWLVRDRELQTLGALMLDGMCSTVIWAQHLGIDPYGQPAVEAIKRRVARRLAGSQPS